MSIYLQASLVVPFLLSVRQCANAEFRTYCTCTACAVVIRKAGPLEPKNSNAQKMCHTEHVFHRPCRHWGRERFVGEPCCRSRIVNGRHTGCGYIENLGSSNSDEYCHDCQYRRARGGGWKPFAQLSNDGWAKLEQKIQQRSIESDGETWNGEFPLSRGKDYSVEESRSR